MSSRMIAAFVSSWLPALGLVLPVSAAYQTNAIVVGTLATVLAAFAIVDKRACYGAAILAVWTAFMPFFIDATIVEMTLNEFWAVAMFTSLIGPFSESPAVTWTRPAQAPAAAPAYEREVRKAA